MVTWYWSADTLYWQVSMTITGMFNIKEKRYKPMLHVSLNLLPEVSRPCIFSASAAILLAIIIMRKSVHGLPFLSDMSVELRLPTLWSAGALLSGSFSNEDSDAGDEDYKKSCFCFTFECRRSVNLLSTPIGRDICSDLTFAFSKVSRK